MNTGAGNDITQSPILHECYIKFSLEYRAKYLVSFMDLCRNVNMTFHIISLRIFMLNIKACLRLQKFLDAHIKFSSIRQYGFMEWVPPYLKLLGV